MAESRTHSRRRIHERYLALLDAPDSAVLTPAADLAESIRNLNSVQLSVLDRLFKVFAEGPHDLVQDRILDDLRREFS